MEQMLSACAPVCNSRATLGPGSNKGSCHGVLKTNLLETRPDLPLLRFSRHCRAHVRTALAHRFSWWLCGSRP